MITFFLVLLAVSSLIDVVFGLWAIVGWGSFASTFSLNVASGEDIRMMGFLLGLVLLFLAYVQVQALLWIRREKDVGYPIALAFAGFLVISSLLMSLIFGRMVFLAIDGARGVLLGIFGAIALRSPLTVKELRLPARSHRAGRRSSSTRGRRRTTRETSTRRPRRTGGRREMPAHASSRGPNSMGARTRRSSSRRTTRRRTGTRMAEPDGGSGPAAADSDRLGRGRQERYYDDRRPPRGGRDSGAPPRRRRTPWAGPVVPPGAESGAEDYGEEFADNRASSRPAGSGGERFPEGRASSRSIGEEAERLEDRVVEDVAEAPGPPKPFRRHGPEDVVSALDWFAKPKGGDKAGGQNNGLDNGSRHRRKPERSPGASFRPKEKRVRRPLGGDSTSNGERGGEDLSHNGEEA